MKLTNSLLLIPIALAGTLEVGAEALSEGELIRRMDVFGEGFLIQTIDAPPIVSPARWIGRRTGDYVYEFTTGSDDGAILQIERHLPSTENPDLAWERHIGERLVETYVITNEKDVVIVQEVDHRYGFRMEIEPGIHWQANAKVGDEWVAQSNLSAFDLETGELSKEGKLTSTITYEGAFRVRTSAGVFDSVLLREDFVLHIGPLKAEDDRFLFFAKDVGLVAEIEAVRASALLFFHLKEDAAKVLRSYPGKTGVSAGVAEEREVTGTRFADELSGTMGTDHFYGGDGADVFVINYLSAVPDEIIDFDPDEGDTIALTFPEIKGRRLASEDFWITPKGVVKWRVRSGREQAVVDTNRTGLTVSLGKRKGRYLLTFERKL